MTIPELLLLATTASNPCQLDRRAAIEVLQPYLNDPCFPGLLHGTLKLQEPSGDWDHAYMTLCRQRHLNAMAEANPLDFALEDAQIRQQQQRADLRQLAEALG